MRTKTQTYWEDVAEGQELPSTYSLLINYTQVVKCVSGTQDFYEVHHDTEYARAHGHKDIFVMERFMNACFNRLIQDWIGDEGFLCKLHMELRKMNRLGDTITFKGKVTKKYVKDGEHYIDADVWCENDKEGITTPCKCTVILPSKS